MRRIVTRQYRRELHVVKGCVRASVPATLQVHNDWPVHHHATSIHPSHDRRERIDYTVLGRQDCSCQAFAQDQARSASPRVRCCHPYYMMDVHTNSSRWPCLSFIASTPIPHTVQARAGRAAGGRAGPAGGAGSGGRWVRGLYTAGVCKLNKTKGAERKGGHRSKRSKTSGRRVGFCLRSGGLYIHTHI